MSDASKISVAMATCNGGKYLSEQLESLTKQRHLPFELVACDDGSTDGTVEILNEFRKVAPFAVHVYRNKQNLGYADNFFKAASLCSGDWVAFCDQDDVWLPNRLADVGAAIASGTRANIILQNAILSHEDLTSNGRLFPARIKPGYHRPRSQYGFWVWPGFLKTVRASCFKVRWAKRPRSYFPGDGVMSHDKWTCLIANATGGVLVLPEPAALYRRHGAALTGDYAAQSWSQRIGKALPVSGDHYAFLAEVALETADYLRRIAEQDHNFCKKDFLKAAQGFDQIAKVLSDRSVIYKSGNILVRLRSLASIALAGGYVGPRMFALGLGSAAKDVLQAIGVLEALRTRSA